MVEEKQQFEVWREDLQIVLESKVDELQMFGYEQATVDDVWECAIYKLRKKKGFVRLHEFVNTIFSIKPTEFMNYLTIDNYNTSEWLSNEDLLDEVLGRK